MKRKISFPDDAIHCNVGRCQPVSWSWHLFVGWFRFASIEDRTMLVGDSCAQVDCIIVMVIVAFKMKNGTCFFMFKFYLSVQHFKFVNEFGLKTSQVGKKKTVDNIMLCKSNKV